MSEKVVGYLLLVFGLFMILFPAFNIYQIFKRQVRPIQFFAFSGISMDMAAPLMASLPKELRDAGIRIPPSSQEIISGEMVNQPLNLFTHIFFMGFLSSIGMKVASVGVMLLRPIVVKVKEVPSKPLG